jgi:hypothetical protein
MTKKKIALIGNMNNNHFSLMRYLRDLGHDAHLFIYKNDSSNNSHFETDGDTWFIDRWKPFIHRSEIYNGSWRILFNIWARQSIAKKYGSFDLIIANGFMPGLAWLVNIKIDIFAPYSVHGDFLFNYNNTLKSKLSHIFFSRIQIKGLKNNCRFIYSSSESRESLVMYNKYDLRVQKISIPMVYTKENPSVDEISGDKILSDILTRLDSKKILFMHSSHFWVGQDLYSLGKRTDVLVRGYAEYIRNKPDSELQLVLVEYGRDVAATRLLISSLNISERVIWLPKLSRRQLMVVLEKVFIGASEFGGSLWGGVGWEFLSKGIPFFHFYNPIKEHESLTELPPFFNVSSSTEICDYLGMLCENYRIREQMSVQILDWFDKNQGLELAKKYVI